MASNHAHNVNSPRSYHGLNVSQRILRTVSPSSQSRYSNLEQEYHQYADLNLVVFKNDLGVEEFISHTECTNPVGCVLP